MVLGTLAVRRQPLVMWEVNIPQMGPSLGSSSTTPHDAWNSDRITIAARFKEKLKHDMAHLGRTMLGDTQASVAKAVQEVRASSMGCHCGACRMYPRCKYQSPRHVGDVEFNVRMTGTKSGAAVAAALRHLSLTKHDAWVSFGHGAGACIAGAEIACPLPDTLLGVEVEPQAVKVASRVFPTLITRRSVHELPPVGGRLLVLSGLVFNVVTPSESASWLQWATSAGQVTWVDVGRPSEPDSFPLAEISRKSRFRQSFEYTFESDSNGGYRVRAFEFTNDTL